MTRYDALLPHVEWGSKDKRAAKQPLTPAPRQRDNTAQDTPPHLCPTVGLRQDASRGKHLDGVTDDRGKGRTAVGGDIGRDGKGKLSRTHGFQGRQSTRGPAWLLTVKSIRRLHQFTNNEQPASYVWGSAMRMPSDDASI